MCVCQNNPWSLKDHGAAQLLAAAASRQTAAEPSDSALPPSHGFRKQRRVHQTAPRVSGGIEKSVWYLATAWLHNTRNMLYKLLGELRWMCSSCLFVGAAGRSLKTAWMQLHGRTRAKLTHSLQNLNIKAPLSHILPLFDLALHLARLRFQQNFDELNRANF